MVAVYIRVGSPERSVHNLNKQLSVCSNFLESNGKKIEYVYEDIISAHQLDKRFIDILDDMIKRDIDELYVQNWSRVSRNTKTIIEIVEMFRENKKRIISIENFPEVLTESFIVDGLKNKLT
ncbi:recombinase family protein [Paenibacillaceae bacterium]|nr:recombinase family protein [Paenibacillaceae bacterium]